MESWGYERVAGEGPTVCIVWSGAWGSQGMVRKWVRVAHAVRDCGLLRFPPQYVLTLYFRCDILTPRSTLSLSLVGSR